MTDNAAAKRLTTLLQFLQQDPDNVTLLRDAMSCAAAAHDFEHTEKLADELRRLDAWTDQDSSDHAVALMRAGHPGQAAEHFEALLEQRPDDAALTFNLAWARALMQDTAGARAALTETVTATLPQAAQLDIQLLHDAGEFETAIERAHEHMARHPDYAPLLAAVSVLALDVEDRELARACASKAGGHPDALTSLGTLTLEDQDPAAAQALFEQALAINDTAPRAWIGLGLVSMTRGENSKAGELIDKGAELFGSHLGSWIAAGWSYLLSGDRGTARARFIRAMELDDTFSEAHGSLAVMDILEGDVDSGKRGIAIAQRLDRNCFSAAFGNVLIAAGQGDEDRAARIMELALKQPLGDGKNTLAEAIARMAQ